MKSSSPHGSPVHSYRRTASASRCETRSKKHPLQMIPRWVSRYGAPAATEHTKLAARGEEIDFVSKSRMRYRIPELWNLLNSLSHSRRNRFKGVLALLAGFELYPGQHSRITHRSLALPSLAGFPGNSAEHSRKETLSEVRSLLKTPHLGCERFVFLLARMTRH